MDDKEQLEKELLELEIEIDRSRWEAARELAEDLVRGRGYTEDDEEFWFEVEQETRRQYDEEL